MKYLNASKVRTHQRKFLQAIHRLFNLFFSFVFVKFDLFAVYSLRKVKLDQRKLTDNVNAVSDITRVNKKEFGETEIICYF